VDVAVGQAVQAGQVLVELSDTSGLAQQVASAQAALDQAQYQLDQLLNPGLGTDPRSITAAQIKVQQAETSLQQTQATLSRDQAAAAQAAEVTTPVAGTVVSVAVIDGQQVNGGQTIAVVQPAGDPTVTVAVPEQDLLYLPVGTPAAVSIPALQETITGTVTARANVPAGQETLSPSGLPASGGSANNPALSQQSLYDLTITLSKPATGAPAGAEVSVSFRLLLERYRHDHLPEHRCGRRAAGWDGQRPGGAGRRRVGRPAAGHCHQRELPVPAAAGSNERQAG
jgi:multidrug resistance efflux pump